MSFSVPFAPATPAAGEAGDLRNARLRVAARQFEASLMSELTKPFSERGGLFADSDTDSGDRSGDAVSGYGSEALARAMADRGGFGIARSIVAEVTREQHHSLSKGAGDSAKKS